MHVLTIEDETMISSLISTILRQSKINVSVASSGEEGLELIETYSYDLILLDLSLPDMTGHEVLRRMRDGGNHTPVLILTGATDTDSKIKGFGLGADDYVMKPFRKEELVARIHAIVRRAQGHSQSIIRTGRLSVNLDTKSAEIGGTPMKLTKKEYQILEFLSLSKGRILEKEHFLDHLYGGVDEPDTKVIDVFICKLRKKIASLTGNGNYIETVWGRGYKLSEPAADSTA